MRNKKVTTGTMLMLILLAVVATFNITFFVSGEYYNSRLGDVESIISQYSKLEEIGNIIDRYFVGPYEQDMLMEGAAIGYVFGLEDEWSGYYTQEQTEIIVQGNENTYVGIGITVSFAAADLYTITGVTAGGPAAQAGLAILDVITAIDGVAADDFETSEAFADAIRGEEGSTVVLTVQRGNEELTISVTRAAVFNEMITTRVLEGNIGYIGISDFEKNADVEFLQKLDGLLAQGVQGIVFDVRFNTGGYLVVMTEMLDRLLPEGTVISTVNRAGEETEYTSDAQALDMPMSVIVNGYSVSAAEFFAAALQEYELAEVIGEPTGGKGYMQNLFMLSDGSSLNLSTERYYTPKGNSLVDVGVIPDQEVPLTDEQLSNFANLSDEQDPQLQAAIAAVQAQLPETAPEGE